MRNPLPTLTRLREAGPVVRVRAPLLGKAWVATTLEAVSEVLKDKDSPDRGSCIGSTGR
jgi:hypothetical protein